MAISCPRTQKRPQRDRRGWQSRAHEHRKGRNGTGEDGNLVPTNTEKAATGQERMAISCPRTQKRPQRDRRGWQSRAHEHRKGRNGTGEDGNLVPTNTEKAATG